MADQEETTAAETTTAADTAGPPTEQAQEDEVKPSETTDDTGTSGEPTGEGARAEEKTEAATDEQKEEPGEETTHEETAEQEAKPEDEGDGQVAEEVPEVEGEKQKEEQSAEGEEQTKDGEDKQEGEKEKEEKVEGDDAEPKEGEEVVETKEGEGATTESKGGEDEAEVEGEDGEKKEGGEDEKEEGDEDEKKEEDEDKKGEEKKDEEEDSKSPVPQSDTFAEGERAESPIGVGEKLSREGSPIQEQEAQQPDKLEPGTPERSRPPSETGEDKHLETFREEEEEEEEDEEEEEEEQFDREALMEQYNNAIAEREKLQAQNYQLQHKLAEHFRKKKQDESRQDYDKNANDQDTKYVKYMGQLDELRKEDMNIRDTYEHSIEELKEKCEERKQMVDEERKKFMEFKKQVALNSFSNRSGKPIPPKDIDQYLSNETKKEQEVVNVRLENIKLKNKLKKKEIQLKSKEELAENLHLIDFEQLKIENQTYNEKIEERNEELLKLRKKITSTVQVLTHLKEKLQFVQAENQVQKTTLRQVESEAAQKRDILSRTKQARDALRIDNHKLRQSCGLLGNEPLLRDFEERKDEGDELRDKSERLKMQHAELTLNCNQVRRKIEQARASHG